MWEGCGEKASDGFIKCDASGLNDDNECPDGTVCKGTCKHKPLWPIRIIEWFGFFIQFFVLVIANAGGIAGGSILIAFIIIFNKFNSKTIASMNAFYNFLSALVRFLMNINAKNPVKPIQH